jgi:hypothetical protein
MTAASLIKSIQSAYSKLSEGGRRVPELIVSQPEEVARSSAVKVAQQLTLPESTVVRFASAIAFDGYRASRQNLTEAAKLISIARDVHIRSQRGSFGLAASPRAIEPLENWPGSGRSDCESRRTIRINRGAAIGRHRVDTTDRR